MESETVIQVLLRERIRITAFAVVVLRDVHSADDVFQHVVMNALEKRSEFLDTEHLFAWSIRTARFRAIDLARKNRLMVLPDDVLDLMEQSQTNVEDVVAEGSERSVALQKCMAKLPISAREMLRMRYHDGLSVKNIAERFQRSVEAVYQSFSRVHRTLRTCVEKELVQSIREVP
jgi:RNA polymerase sigma-70 factor, ECF subfamily